MGSSLAIIFHAYLDGVRVEMVCKHAQREPLSKISIAPGVPETEHCRATFSNIFVGLFSNSQLSAYRQGGTQVTTSLQGTLWVLEVEKCLTTVPALIW